MTLAGYRPHEERQSMNLPRSLLLSTILVFTYPSLAISEPMEMLYWTAERGIGRSYPDASNKEWIVEADLRRPGSIAIDEIAERVYWTHQAVIHRSNLDGTDLEVYSRAAFGWASDRSIMTGLEIDIDSKDRKMYSTAIWWGDHTGEGMVEAFDLDADSLTVQGLAPSVNSFHAYWPYGTTVDPVNRKLYFLDWFSFYAVALDSLLSSDEHLFYPHLDRWPATTVYSQEEMEVERPGDWQGIYDLDLDHESGTMYWSLPNGIMQSRLEDGREGISLYMDVPAREIAVDSDEKKLYWTQPDGEIFRSALEAPSPQLVIDASEFRFLPEEERTRWFRPNVVDLAVHKGRVYWTDRSGTLRRCSRDGSNLEELFAPEVRRPSGIFVDSRRGKVLWGDLLAGTVMEANLDGSEIRAIAARSVAVGDVLTVGDKVYWTDNETEEVWSADLDGSDAAAVSHLEDPSRSMAYEQSGMSWPPGRRYPSGSRYPVIRIAHDATGKLLCWSHVGSIYCADSDGGKASRILDGERHVSDIALDDDGFIYWIAGGLWRMDLQVGTRELLFEDHAGQSCALAPDGIYLTSFGSGGGRESTRVYHLDRDGTDSGRLGPDRGPFEYISYNRPGPSTLLESLALYSPAATEVSYSSAALDPFLGPSSPNPFNASTRIPYTLSRPGPVSLVIYNSLGQPVQTLVNGVKTAGSYTVYWSPGTERPLASGVYYSRLVTPQGSLTRKLTLLR